MVILHGVLHDGEAQPRAAGGLGVALIHPVEPLEHPALVLRGDADAGIRHRDGGGAVLRGHLHLYGAVGDVILDGVVAEVEDHLIQQPPHADDRGVAAVHRQGHPLLGGGILQVGHGLLTQGQQVHRLRGHGIPLVQLGQADDILHQRHHAGGLVVDMAHKAGHILRLHHAALDQLGAAHDALQRGLQFVGDVGGELPAVALGVLLLCHVEGQQHCTHHLAAGLDAAHIQLVLPAIALAAQLAVALLPGCLHRKAQLMAAVHRQEVTAHTALVRLKELTGGVVDAEHRPLLVQQHQPFLHTAGDLGELVGLLPQGPQLGVDLLVLVVDAAQKRSQLLVGVVFQRMLQVQPVQGIHDAAGQAAGHEPGEDQRRHQHHQHGLEHSQRQHPGGGTADGDTQHRAVRQAASHVQGLLQKGIRVAATFAAAVFQGLLHLLTAGVVLHGGHVRHLRIVQHPAVGGDPRQAEPLRRKALQIGRTAVFHAADGEAQFIL